MSFKEHMQQTMYFRLRVQAQYESLLYKNVFVID